MSDSSDANLDLKKRARRRLVGAVAFAGLAAIVLPMVMDEEPKPQVDDVQIRIPGQDQTPFPARIVRPQGTPAVTDRSGTAEMAPAPARPLPDVAQAVGKPLEKKSEPLPGKSGPEKPGKTEKTEKTEKPEKPEKPEKTAARLGDKPSGASSAEAQRGAAAILNGKSAEASRTSASSSGQFVILIGAFANPGNVKLLQGKIGELGIKVFTEPLDSPEGKKTRVRAGPFSSRDAANKALEKMKRIGVNGVIAAKQ